jgi:hypothetical protein
MRTAVTHLRRDLVRRLARHSPILSGIGACDKPGARVDVPGLARGSSDGSRQPAPLSVVCQAFDRGHQPRRRHAVRGAPTPPAAMRHEANDSWNSNLNSSHESWKAAEAPASSHWNSAGILERVPGIEPGYSAWKAAALQLSYTRAPPKFPTGGRKSTHRAQTPPSFVRHTPREALSPRK